MSQLDRELARVKRERSDAEALVREAFRLAKVAPEWSVWFKSALRVLVRADDRKRGGKRAASK